MSQSIAVASVPSTDADKPQNSPGRRLSHEETAKIVKLAADGLNQTQIALVIPCSQSTVSAVLSNYSDTTTLASARIRGSALQAVEDWIEASAEAKKDGNHKPAKDLLIAAGVVQPDQAGPQVSILMGDGSLAVGPAPTFASEHQALTGEKPQLSDDVGSDN